MVPTEGQRKEKLENIKYTAIYIMYIGIDMCSEALCGETASVIIISKRYQRNQNETDNPVEPMTMRILLHSTYFVGGNDDNVTSFINKDSVIVTHKYLVHRHCDQN